MEAPTGIEPAKKGFADLCVTIPPQRHFIKSYIDLTIIQDCHNPHISISCIIGNKDLLLSYRINLRRDHGRLGMALTNCVGLVSRGLRCNRSIARMGSAVIKHTTTTHHYHKP